MTDEPLVPPYGGAADRGVEQSLPDETGEAGDLLDFVTAEHRKLAGLWDEILTSLDRGDLDWVRLRLGGIVRETREYLAAEGHVVVPALTEMPASLIQAATVQQALDDFDSLNPDVDEPRLRELAGQVLADLRAQDDEVVPRIVDLDAAERWQLGEDMRQVMG
jgi:hypothetical protein